MKRKLVWKEGEKTTEAYKDYHHTQDYKNALCEEKQDGGVQFKRCLFQFESTSFIKEYPTLSDEKESVIKVFVIYL